MADYLVTDTELTSIADAIRTKGGTSASLTFPTGFVNAIDAIPSGGGGGVNTCTLTIGSDGNVTVSNFDTTPSGDYMVTASVLQAPAMYTDYNGTESFFFDAGSGTYIVATIGEGVACSIDTIGGLIDQGTLEDWLASAEGSYPGIVTEIV